MRAAVLVLGLLVAPAIGELSGGGGAAAAQLAVSRVVEPDTVAIGQPFISAVRVEAPGSGRVEYLEFESGDTLQALDGVRIAPGEASGEIAVYPLVAWVAGTPLAAAVPIRVTAPDGTTSLHEVALRLPVVTSVLPADMEGVEPRPPSGLLLGSPAGSAWWWLLVALAALLAAALTWWLLARRDEEGEATPADPREWALAELHAAGAHIEAGALPELYRRVSWVVRIYIWRLHPELGPDLTTTELLDRLRADGSSALIEPLEILLGAADRVKFARHRPSVDEAGEELLRAREWVRSFPPAPEETTVAREAA